MPAYLSSAYLRVYQPVSALDAAARSALQRIGAGESLGAPACASTRQSELSLVPPSERADVYTRMSDGETYVCAALPGVRSLERLAGMPDVPPSAGGLFSRDEV